MAYVDEYDILSDKQVVTKTTYSQRAKQLLALNDWGSLNNLYVQITALGAFTTGASLTIQLIASEDKEFTKVKPIAEINSIPKAEIVKGATWYLPIPRAGKKYLSLALKYIPAGKEADENNALGDIDICPNKPFMKPETELENGFTAFFTQAPSDAISGITYPYASDKMKNFNTLP